MSRGRAPAAARAVALALAVAGGACAGAAGAHAKRGPCVALCEQTNEGCVLDAVDAPSADKCERERRLCVESCP